MLHLTPTEPDTIPRREGGCLIWAEVRTRLGDTIEVSTTDASADCVIVEIGQGPDAIDCHLTRHQARTVAQALLAAAGERP